jgi:outer membrane receptor protein involved in Fe transport
MKKTLLIIIACIACLELAAQGGNRPGGQRGNRTNMPPKTVTGMVVDAQSGTPLEYTNISFYALRDSSLVTGGITDVEGKFAIDMRPGRFYAIVQFISYKSITIAGLGMRPDSDGLDMGVIELQADTEILDDVVIAGDKDQVELRLDKRVFNVGKDLSNTGRTAVDILNNVPSVAVDQDGNVSLRGSENVRILVDGKPSGIIGISSSDGLRQLQGDIIESIEVVTNPSARYDAEGDAGIINIVLKKKRKKGLNGGITLNTGYPNNHGASFNFNYRKKKVNLFANYGIRYRMSPGSGYSLQKYTEIDTSYRTDQNLDFTRGGLNNNIRTGIEYSLNDKNTISGSFLYRISDGANERTTNFKDYNSDDILFRDQQRFEDENEEDENYQYDLNYRKTFKKKGQVLTADVQYRDNGEIEKGDIDQTTLFLLEGAAEPDETQRSTNTESENSWLLQADYAHPIGAKGKAEVGYRGNFRALANDYLVEDLIGTTWSNNINLSNDFRYKEDVNAVYGIYGNEIGKISYQAGIRVEATDIAIDLLQTAESFRKNYVNFFPSAFFTYKISEGNSVQTSYSRRLRRPRSRNLNPFPYSIGDNRNLRTGNPDLNPTYTDSYELGYLKTWKKSNLFSSVYYRKTNGVVQRITERIDTINISKPVNLSVQNAFGLEFNYSYDLSKWWKISGNANFYRAITEGVYSDQVYEQDAYTMNTRLNSRMTIKKKVNYQMNWRYRAPQETTQGSRKAYTTLDLSWSMDVMNNKGTLVANMRDVFNTGKYRYTVEDPAFVLDGQFQRRPRSYTLSFSYRFNQKKSRRGNRDRQNQGGGGLDDGDFG